MKKLLLAGVLSAAVVGVPVVAQAHPGHTPQGPKPNSHTKRCKTLKRGYVVTGDNAQFSPTTLNLDGTYTGDVSLQNLHANHHAKGATSPFSVVNAKVVFDGVTDQNNDGSVGLDDVVATDKVHLIGWVAYTKKGSKKHRCDNSGYGAATIKKVVIAGGNAESA